MFPWRYEEQFEFQTFVIELYKQPKTKKEQIRLVIISIGVDFVAKTNDEIYVLGIFKIFSFHLFSL